MALKSLFFSRKITKITQRLGALPHTPSVIRLSCSSLFSLGPKVDNFCGKNLLMALFPYQILVALLVASTVTDGFFERLYGPHTKRAKKRCWRYVSLFFRHEYKIFKIAHNLYEPSQLTATN